MSMRTAKEPQGQGRTGWATYGFNGDENTGLHSTGAGDVRILLDGTAVWSASSSGSVTAGITFKTVSYQDQISGTGVTASTNPYPLAEIPIYANGQTAYGKFRPFLTGVTCFYDGTVNVNTDPNIVGISYNWSTTTGVKDVTAEPSFADVLEVDYKVEGDSFLRHMERYWVYSKPTTGDQIRPITYDYTPSSHKIAEAALMVKSASYGGTLDIVEPVARTVICRIGNSTTGTGVCGMVHYGATGLDTKIEMEAFSGQSSRLVFGCNGTAGAILFKTVSTKVMGIDTSGVADQCRFGVNPDNGFFFAINSTSDNAGITVEAPTNAYTTIRGKQKSGQTTNVFQVLNSSDAHAWGVNGDGKDKVLVTTVAIASGTTQGSNALTKPMNNVTGANGSLAVTLPATAVGDKIVVCNNGASNLIVFPASGSKINGGSTDASVTQAANVMVEYIAVSATEWYSH